MPSKLSLVALVFLLSGCLERDVVYAEPHGLLLWFVIISFIISVACAIYLIASSKEDTVNKRLVVGVVGLVFLGVTLWLMLRH
jgi:cell division protein FtsW (lipid II flippase)